jgi:hypothetical protein
MKKPEVKNPVSGREHKVTQKMHNSIVTILKSMIEPDGYYRTDNTVM